MSDTAVLVCRDAGLDLDMGGVAYTVVGDLCSSAAAAAAALRRFGARRVVLGLCDAPASSEQIAALRRAGAEPFGVESVVLGGRSAREAAALLRAATAKLDALPEGEHGRPRRPAGAISRRTLFSLASPATDHVPLARVDAATCVGAGQCGLCIACCPAEAIAALGPVPTVDASACTACGQCVGSCPHGAIRLAGSSLGQLEAQLSELLGEVAGVIFACTSAHATAPDGWALVELPTLGVVTPGWILGVQARGAEVKLVGCGQDCCAEIGSVEAMAARLATRRATPLDTPLRLAEPRATAEGALALADPHAVVRDCATPLGILDVDVDRCTLCGVCAASCPTTALAFEESAEGTVLRLTPAACVACRRCVETCPEAAIDVDRGIDVAQLRAGTLELAREAPERCAHCGAVLPPRPMRRRVHELLGRPDASLELCSRCTVSSNRSATNKESST